MHSTLNTQKFRVWYNQYSVKTYEGSIADDTENIGGDKKDSTIFIWIIIGKI